MKNMMQIALAFSLVIGLSFSAHAAEITTTEGGAELQITDSGSGPGLNFTPSGNTVMTVTADGDDYYIGAASSKTTTDNGLDYCMISGYSGYYQKTQASDGGVATGGTAGTAPTGWTAMGGAEAEAGGDSGGDSGGE